MGHPIANMWGEEGKTRFRIRPNFEKMETVRISNLSNEELLMETVNAGSGDDYDGEFTQEGTITYRLLIVELVKRLGSIKFIDPAKLDKGFIGR
jgi:hypothetical protein